jgi:Spy/CpxP family protein refolding chaperone
MAFQSSKPNPIFISTLMLASLAGVGFLPNAVIAKTEMATSPQSSVTDKVPVISTSGSGASLVEQLKLTPKQKQQIAGFRANRTRQINQVLTPEQRTQFEQFRKSGKSVSDALRSVNLKPDQKTKILNIAKQTTDSIKGILTPEQKKQLEIYLKKHSQGSPSAVE